MCECVWARFAAVFASFVYKHFILSELKLAKRERKRERKTERERQNRGIWWCCCCFCCDCLLLLLLLFWLWFSFGFHFRRIYSWLIRWDTHTHTCTQNNKYLRLCRNKIYFNANKFLVFVWVFVSYVYLILPNIIWNGIAVSVSNKISNAFQFQIQFICDSNLLANGLKNMADRSREKPIDHLFN